MKKIDELLLKYQENQNDYSIIKEISIQYRKVDFNVNALEYIDKALKIRPNALDMIVDKAECLYKIGNYQEAEQYFQRWIDAGNKEIPVLHKYFRCLKRENKKIDDKMKDLIIYIYQNEQLYREEIELLQEYNLKKNDENIKLIIEEYPKKKNGLLKEVESMNIEQAKKYINEKITDDKKRVKIFSEVLFERKMYEELFEYLKENIRSDYMKINSYLLFAKYKKELKEYSIAIQTLEEFEESNPEQKYIVQKDLIELYILNGDIEKAKKEINLLTNYLEEKEKLNKTFDFWKYTSLARFYRMLGDKEKSEYYKNKYETAKSKYRIKKQ